MEWEKIIDSKEQTWGLRLFRGALIGLSVLYGVVVRMRILAYRSRLLLRDFRLPTRVISVGNIAVGGTGKTPLVTLLSEYFQRLGKRVVILSRGYKRKGKGVVVVSDGQRMLVDRERAGDEPYLFGRKLSGVPVVVGESRQLAGWVAIRDFAPDVLLLDDGFQHLKLRRDLDIVVIDGSNPFGNGMLLPRGILREPLSSLKRAQLFCITRVDQSHQLEHLRIQLRRINPKARQIETVHRPRRLRMVGSDREVSLPFLSGRKVFALSSLGNPDSFERTLRSLGAQIVGRARYRDHYDYTVEDLEASCQRAREAGSEAIVTTEKDVVRFPPYFDPLAEHLEIPMFVLEIELAVVAGEAVLADVVGASETEAGTDRKTESLVA
ncbi:MAG: tetraacyldisaccharide 4'-kinase [Candidatus Latescibacterota bacterium]|nr:MAG: tetraacyldisaccharide 4'-kinase [Candidatus Latescibacterota bacterium]